MFLRDECRGRASGPDRVVMMWFGQGLGGLCVEAALLMGELDVGV